MKNFGIDKFPFTQFFMCISDYFSKGKVIKEEVLDFSPSKKDLKDKEMDYRARLKKSQIERESTSQNIPGDDKSLRSFFKLYRIFYILAGAMAYALMKNDKRALSHYKYILEDLQVTDPKVNGVLVDKQTYFLR